MIKVSLNYFLELQKLIVSHRDRLYSCIGSILRDDALRSRYLEVCMPWVYSLVHNQLTPTLSRGTHKSLLSSLKELMANDVVGNGGDRSHNNSEEYRGYEHYTVNIKGRPSNSTRLSDYRTI